MFKILIVEDDQDKLKKITGSLNNIEGVDINSISNVMDARSAKLLLRSTCFDYLILDIAIPARIDEDVRKDGGTELLRELLERDVYKMPVHVLCITAFDDVYKKEANFMYENTITFLYCDPTVDNWQSQIKVVVSRAVAANNCQKYTTSDYESFLVIVCALEIPELRAVLGNGWEWEKVNIENDATVYYKSRISVADNTRVCYAAAAPRKGMPASAVLASKMISTFRPKYLAMSGITSGYKEKAKLGDVIVADPVWDWGSGKLIVINCKTVFEPEPHQLDLEVEIRNKLKLMAQDTSALSLIRNNCEFDRPSHELSMLLGPLASGAAVLADDITHQRILKQHRGLLGIDMETYAVFAAAQEATAPRPIVFAMKSVVDFADEEKDDKYHKYSSYTSAEAIKYFAQNYLT